MATHRIRIEALPGAMRHFRDVVVPGLSRALRDGVATAVFLKLPQLSPVGSPTTDPHPGKYRASHIASVGQPRYVVLPDLPAYPIPGAPEIEAVLRQAALDATIFIANAAAPARSPDDSYAGLLEGGRRQYSRVATGKTQWIGSTQAPSGIYGPALEAVAARRATIEAAAIREAERLI